MIRPTYIKFRRLQSLRPVLVRWIRLNKRSCKNFSWHDCAWWCGERTTTGVLAAAAWSLGGVALEEYVTPKSSGGKPRTGRCDIYIDVKEAKFVCEVKQLFARFGRRDATDVSDVEEMLSSACHDASNLPASEGNRLGICFVTPSIPISDPADIESRLEDWLARLRSLEWDAMGWCFPIQARQLKWTNNRIFPGVVVLVREVHRST